MKVPGFCQLQNIVEPEHTQFSALHRLHHLHLKIIADWQLKGHLSTKVSSKFSGLLQGAGLLPLQEHEELSVCRLPAEHLLTKLLSQC